MGVSYLDASAGGALEGEPGAEGFDVTYPHSRPPHTHKPT